MVTQRWHVAYFEDRVHSVDINVKKCGHGWIWKCLWRIDYRTGGAEQNDVKGLGRRVIDGAW